MLYSSAFFINLVCNIPNALLLMKYILFSSLLFLFSCASQENNGSTKAASDDSIVAVTAATPVTPVTAVPEEEPQILLDGIKPGTELTRKQMVFYFHADTSYYESFNVTSYLAGVNLLGDSLMIAIVSQNDNNCSKSALYVINRYSFATINEKEIKLDCDMDDQSQDQLSFELIGKTDFVLTTETYDKGADSDGPSATVKEYWTILPDGQFKKSKSNEESKAAPAEKHI